MSVNRRQWMRSAAMAAGGAVVAGAGSGAVPMWADAPAPPKAEAAPAPDRTAPPGERPRRDPGVEVLNPRGRVPMSFISDDSTCLVNLAHFGVPQFAEVFPARYKQDWKSLPREIPDSFVREFAGWAKEHGVKGKYSVVPYPGLVGRLDRGLPGWSRQELDASLELLRTDLAADWDFTPEMITHTRAIDLKTGQPYTEASDRFMENWRFTDGKSVDEIAEYIAYALRILKGAGVPCEGVTTPGGFGGKVRAELSAAVFRAVREVFGTEVPFYFKYVVDKGTDVAPRVEHASGIDGPDAKCVVNVVSCTGDWFGGWDGLEAGSVERFIDADRKGGRLPEVIAAGGPAVMLCHWPGMYFNGRKVGFDILRNIVARLEAGYDNLIWMKLSELARYWAARELTAITREGGKVTIRAPYACPRFTVKVAAASDNRPTLTVAGKVTPLSPADGALKLDSGLFRRDGGATVACFDLPKGESVLQV